MRIFGEPLVFGTENFDFVIQNKPECTDTGWRDLEVGIEQAKAYQLECILRAMPDTDLLIARKGELDPDPAFLIDGDIAYGRLGFSTTYDDRLNKKSMVRSFLWGVGLGIREEEDLAAFRNARLERAVCFYDSAKSSLQRFVAALRQASHTDFDEVADCIGAFDDGERKCEVLEAIRDSPWSKGTADLFKNYLDSHVEFLIGSKKSFGDATYKVLPAMVELSSMGCRYIPPADMSALRELFPKGCADYISRDVHEHVSSVLYSRTFDFAKRVALIELRNEAISRGIGDSFDWSVAGVSSYRG